MASPTRDSIACLLILALGAFAEPRASEPIELRRLVEGVSLVADLGEQTAGAGGVDRAVAGTCDARVEHSARERLRLLVLAELQVDRTDLGEQRELQLGARGELAVDALDAGGEHLAVGHHPPLRLVGVGAREEADEEGA